MWREKINHTSAVILAFLSRDRFFYIILAFFVLQAAWLAISAAYPMLYDEYYHPGVIELYSQQWSPFISHQTPEDVSRYADLTTNPSFLYHYLMSFPLRITSLVTDSFYVQIVSLRLISVAFVALGLVVFRKLLIEMGLGRAVSHIALLVVSLIPLFPFVAAHINYDNLLFLVTPAFLLYGLRVINLRSVKFANLGPFLILGLAGSLIKTLFLPIAVAAITYVVIHKYIEYRKGGRDLFRDFFLGLNKFQIVALSFLIIILALLFMKVYIGNVVQYGGLQPKCEQVHSLAICQQNPVNGRNISATQNYESNPWTLKGLPDYAATEWAPVMVVRSVELYANVGAPETLDKHVLNHRGERAAPSAILENFFWIGMLVSVVWLSAGWRYLKRTTKLSYFVLIVSFLIFMVLIYTNYKEYSQTGLALAVQPRYFLIVLPIIVGYIVYAGNKLISSDAVKLGILVVSLLIFTQGGGISGYIVNSNASWYWQREKIININLRAKSILEPLIKQSDVKP